MFITDIPILDMRDDEVDSDEEEEEEGPLAPELERTLPAPAASPRTAASPTVAGFGNAASR